jgi:hypothetical protein
MEANSGRTSNLLPPTILADAVETDLDSFYQSKESAFEWFHVQVYTIRIETFHSTTFIAVEMGVRPVIDIWAQTVPKGAVPRTDALHHFSIHEEVKNTVDGYSVYLARLIQCFDDLLRTQWLKAVTDHLQDCQPVWSITHATGLEQL